MGGQHHDAPAVPAGSAVLRQHRAPSPRWLRSLATWMVIFPSVAVGQWALAPVTVLGPVGRAAVLTAVVVPLSVYLGTPATLSLLNALSGPVRGRRPSCRG